MKYLKIIAVAIVFIGLFLLGYYREMIEALFAKQYAVQVEFSIEKYPRTLADIPLFFNSGYKWPMTIFFFVSYTLLNTAGVFLIFPKKEVIYTLSFFYWGILLLSVIFFITGTILHNYRYGMGVVQYLKRIVQTPYVSIFFILYYWKIKPIKR